MNYLTENDAEVLTMARRILSRIASEHEQTYVAGRIEGVCEVAELAIFNAMNEMSAFGKDDVAERYLHTATKEAEPIPTLLPITEVVRTVNREAWK